MTKKVLIGFLILPGILILWGQALDNPYRTGESFIFNSPEPFSVDAWSASYCIDLLKTVRFIELRDKQGQSSIMKVNTVWSYFLDYDETYPEGHRRRYDIIVNGEPLDWKNSFIEYGGDMMNMGVLFLYRNQYPSGAIQYNNNP